MLLFLTLIGSVYILVQLFLWFTWNRTANISLNIKDLPQLSLTVLIPVRDEGKNIAACIDSILKQSYAYDGFEILVVDDHSSDETAEVVSQYSMVKYLALGPNQHGKKAAINAGVKEAAGEIILTLDGDCIVGENWVINMVGSLIGKSADIVVGPLVLQGKSQGNYVQKYQKIEQAALNIINCAGLVSRTFYSSNGANMGFYRKTFLELNPFESNAHIASGDDVFFVHKAVAHGMKIAYVKAKKAIVSTWVQPNFESFLNQRLRWASKSKAYVHVGTNWYLYSFIAHNIVFLILIILSIVHPLSRTYLFYFIISKSIMDYIIIRTGLWWTGQNAMTREIIGASYFQFFYASILLYRILKQGEFTWKGRLNNSNIKKSL
ncbi:glycosyltransferase [Membranihabitans marinus]|uniref:glycosyltransferase n=1 Tax=Membranihabitans marinus TaxID=1227546 RepID=UPI001F2F5737|nr:glycosyltransferase [Membranihabitans marinus]